MKYLKGELGTCTVDFFPCRRFCIKAVYVFVCRRYRRTDRSLLQASVVEASQSSSPNLDPIAKNRPEKYRLSQQP